MFAYFDIGGTKTRVAVSQDGKTFTEPEKFTTREGFDKQVQAIVEIVKRHADGQHIVAAGGGIAGPMNKERTGLVYAPNVPNAWIGQSFADAIGGALNAPTFLENDMAVIGLGEAHHGAGKGDDIIACLTVSTGVGGSRIVHGVPDVSTYGLEPGFQIIDFDGSACPECKSTTLEDYISGTATAHRFGKKAYEVDDPAVWEQLSEWLAIALYNTTLHWSPHSIVLSGSMITGDPAIPVDRVEHHLNKIMNIFPECPKVKKAALGDIGGIYGAMELVRLRTEKH